MSKLINQFKNLISYIVFDSIEVTKLLTDGEQFQIVIAFDNGYSLSIINNDWSYGDMEAALMRDNVIVYEKALGFGDVIRFSNVSEVIQVIKKVKKAL